MSDVLRWTIGNASDALNAAVEMRIQEDLAEDDRTALRIPALAVDTTLNYLALRWFVQSYAWNDIAAAVWIDPRYTHSRCNDFYIPLLERGCLQLDKFMGCEDWVLYLISRISMLEETLTDLTNDSKGGEERGKEAVDLDQALNVGLQHILSLRYEHPLGTRRDTTFVTEMWVHAALVYLHVVAVGSRSNHLKLRSYVARGLSAYENMPRRLDIHIAMPFGVLASMATKDEVRAFLRVAEPPRKFDEINPGQRKTLGVVRECCRMRKCVEESSPTDGVSWRDGAISLGLVILPV